jgi:hypothetical protein
VPDNEDDDGDDDAFFAVDDLPAEPPVQPTPTPQSVFEKPQTGQRVTAPAAAAGEPLRNAFQMLGKKPTSAIPTTATAQAGGSALGPHHGHMPPPTMPGAFVQRRPPFAGFKAANSTSNRPPSPQIPRGPRPRFAPASGLAGPNPTASPASVSLPDAGSHAAMVPGREEGASGTAGPQPRLGAGHASAGPDGETLSLGSQRVRETATDRDPA